MFITVHKYFDKCKLFFILNLKSVLEMEGCPGLVDYVMIWIKEFFIKNEK